MIGVTILHGPHHSAQKSTIATPPPKAAFSKLLSVNSNAIVLLFILLSNLLLQLHIYRSCKSNTAKIQKVADPTLYVFDRIVKNWLEDVYQFNCSI
jgi:hypothetical protein